MPTHSDYISVARRLDKKLGDADFLTLPRMYITGLLRSVSGEYGTRIKKQIAVQQEEALLERRIKVFPKLRHTTTGDTVRLIRTNTRLSTLVDVLAKPDPRTDKRLMGWLEDWRRAKG